MDANPLTYESLDAYCRLTGRRFSAWSVDLFMRIDDELLTQAISAKSVKAPPAPDDNSVPVSDAKTMKSLFRGLMAGQQARKAGAQSKTTTPMT